MASKGQLRIRIVGDDEELTKTTKHAEGEIDRFARGVDKSGKKAGGKFAGGFKGAFKAVAAGAALFGGIDFLANQFTAALDRAALPAQMKAQFGLTAPVAEQAAKTAGDLYAAGWGQSIGEVGSAVAGVERSLRNLGSNEDTARITTQAQALADTFGQEVGPLIDAASKMVKTGLAPNVESALDVMTRGFQKGADSGQDFLDTIIEYSGQFQKLGLDGTTAIGLINQGLAAGARNADFVADAIKEFSIRAVDGSATTAEGFAAIGLNADEMASRIGQGGDVAEKAFQQTLVGLRNIKDPVAQSQAAVALFGTKAEDLGASLFALDPATVAATGGMQGVQGAAQTVADTMGGTMQQNLQSLSRTFQSGLGAALSMVAPLLQTLFGALQPLLPILGPMAVAIGIVVAAQWAWNAALLANPITLIVGLIAGLIATLVLLWQNSETFRNIVTGVWNGIKGAISGVVGWLTGTAWPFIKGVWDGIVSSVTWVRDRVTGAWNAIKSGISTAVTWVRDRWNWVTSKIGGAVDKIKGFLSGMWNGLKSGAKSALNGAIGIINGAIGAINNLISGINNIPGVSIPMVPTIGYLAKGGPAEQGQPYIVGERGPELFVPGASGQVVSHNRLRSMMDQADSDARSSLAALTDSASAAAPSTGGMSGVSFTFNFPNYLGNREEVVREVTHGLRKAIRKKSRGSAERYFEAQA